MIEDMDCKVSESMDASFPADDNDENSLGDFECNICFELVQSPIVTLCGHLYCWPCLYQWLQVHSYSHECPVCKAIIEEDKLVPIYGRGKGRSDSKPRQIPGLDIPDRPVGQRPPTAPPVEINYFRQDELDTMPAPRFGNLTLSALLGIIPAFFTWQVNGVNDATVYGATTGVPYVFSSSFHGGYGHGFHHYSPQAEGKQFLKIFVLLLGSFFILRLIW
ncbi:OLC1v1003133C1 [Oldenlandia corymbosa var. corymbosa]|uniref:E3 ubiquitin-protein ligase RMA n=1 Tax=Oldenlandia corymbosa var. corymbosa TaxID=529605 RepID=A0AAV1DA57_OLDCO|nr:OLC1v1003133C1 [Oldenlandia corymbosa var. corymbosa]